MKLIIDANTVDLPRKTDDTFNSYITRVSDHLLENSKCIREITIDGHVISDDERAKQLFSPASEIRVESTPVAQGLNETIAYHSEEMEKLISDCQNLVTDCLLGEPEQIAESWIQLSNKIKFAINAIPAFAPILNEQETQEVETKLLSELSSTMKEIGEVIQKADVVALSDVLELRLMPWLQQAKVFFDKQLVKIKSITANQKL